jgi:threonyl-tRNA synthetase
MAEFGACHRFEPSGALHGIMRTRAFKQDDAHIFCTEEQIVSETVTFVKMLHLIYSDFGFNDFAVKFSDRPALRAGQDEVWDQAETALKLACTEAGVEYVINPGEGAFYGPKLEFVLRDAIGRDWQCGTFQVDFVLPERLDASYITADSRRARPVMLHRAVVGSFERFIGILIEHCAGRLPMWLAPTQVAVASIVTDANEYGETVVATLKDAGLSVIGDMRNEKIGAKIRDLSLALIPYILVVGRREAHEHSVSIRRLGSDTQTTMSLSDVVKILKTQAEAPDMHSQSLV